MVTKSCALCGVDYVIGIEDKIPLCHECYCTLFDTTKTIDEKIDYVNEVRTDKK